MPNRLLLLLAGHAPLRSMSGLFDTATFCAAIVFCTTAGRSRPWIETPPPNGAELSVIVDQLATATKAWEASASKLAELEKA